MARWVALLRAVNLGGATVLPMATLRAACERAGCASVSTYIASGNALFADERAEAPLRAALAEALLAKTGRDPGILLRTAAELADVAAANPYAGALGNRVSVLFTDAAVPADPEAFATGLADERLLPGKRAIYIHFPSGQARSRLRLAAMATGTIRNMNTVERLAALAAAI